MKFADEHARTPNDKHGLNEYLEREVLSTGAERIFNTLFVMAVCQLEHSRRPLIEDGMQGYLRGLLEKFMGTSFGIFYMMNKADIQKTMGTYTRVYKNAEVNVYNSE